MSQSNSSTPTAAEVIAAFSDEPAKPQPAKKRLSKKVKIIIGVSAWLVLLGGAVGLAFLLRPAPEEVHLGSVVEYYQYIKIDDTGITDFVDDLDYYGYYTSNALKFDFLDSDDYASPRYDKYSISGLKDKTVEQKINDRILETINSVTAEANKAVSAGSNRVDMVISANYFNLLSVYFSYSSYENSRYVYHTIPLTFDLNTGAELTFDDLFSENANVTGILYNGFYNELSTELMFSRLTIERKLHWEATYPNPADCVAMYCPEEGETYDSLRAKRAEIDAKLTNLEAIVNQTVTEYLSGDRRFYLRPSGPVFILANNTTIELSLKDNIRYAVYLKHYRSDSSLFEDASLAHKNQFFTEVSDIYNKFVNVETDTYLVDTMISLRPFSPSNQKIEDLVYDYAVKKALSHQPDYTKFRHVTLQISSPEKTDNRYFGNYMSTIYSHINDLDKSYYDSTYRKAVIDGKSDAVGFYGNHPAKTGSYDPDKINTASGFPQYSYIFVNDKGEIFDSPEAILTDAEDAPSSFPKSWRDYLQNYFYNYFCHPTYSWQTQRCFTDEEKATHEFEYELSYGAVAILLKDVKTPSDGLFRTAIEYGNIPYGYINPAFRNGQ